MTHWSLVQRLSVLFASVAMLVSLLTAWGLMRAVEAHFADMDRQVLNQVLDRAESLIQASGMPLSEDDVPDLLQRALPGPMPMALILRSAEGRQWAADRGVMVTADALVHWPPAGQLQGWDAVQLRVLGRTVGMGADHGSLLAVMDMAHHQHFMQAFRVSLWVGLMLAAVLVGGLGYVVVRRSLQPLNQLAQRMRAVSVQDMQSQQLPLPEPAELHALAEAFNAMLVRLSQAFDRLQDFSANLAHELRTPLNVLMLQAQVTLSQSRSVAEYEDQLVSSLEELTRLTRMVEDMLFLARSDRGLMALTWTSVELGSMLQQLCAFFSTLAEERQLQLTCVGQGVVCADDGLLRRALVNLLSNALTYAPPDSQVEMTVAAEADTVLICVENTAHLAPEQLARLFDRFWRADGVRGNSAHAGLGLAIVQSIVQLHDGRVSAEQVNGLLRVCLRLPVRGPGCTP